MSDSIKRYHVQKDDLYSEHAWMADDVMIVLHQDHLAAVREAKIAVLCEAITTILYVSNIAEGLQVLGKMKQQIESEGKAT